jgi:hypothetical protein
MKKEEPFASFPNSAKRTARSTLSVRKHSRAFEHCAHFFSNSFPVHERLATSISPLAATVLPP